MKKLTSLVALFLMCFGITANAQNPISVDVLTENNQVATSVTDGAGTALTDVSATLATDDKDGLMFDYAQIGNSVVFSRLFKTVPNKVSTLTLTLTGLTENTPYNEASFVLQGWSYKKKDSKYGQLVYDRFIDAVCQVNGKEVASMSNLKLIKKNTTLVTLKFTQEVKAKADDNVVTLKVKRNVADDMADFNVAVSNVSLTYKDQAAIEKEKFDAAKAKWNSFKGYVGFYNDADVAKACEKATLAEAEAFLDKCTPVGIEADKYYRVCNVKNNGHMTVSNEGLQKGGGLYATDVDNLWQFVGGTTGSYKLINANHKKYLALPVKTIVKDPKGKDKDEWKVALADEANALELEVTPLTDAEHTLTFMEGETKTYLTGNQYFIRKATAEDGEQKWYIKPVTQIPVDLHKATADATESWASLYLPFAVTLPEGLEAYTGKVVGNKLLLTAVTEIPAENGVILKGTEEKYDLTIASATGTLANNDLKGTNVSIAKGTNSLVLGNGTNGVGLYSIAADITDLKANKAYLEVTSGVNALKFVFGEATGVENVEVTAPVDNVHYDLSGRRVVNPVKGIYIHNGKKIYVK